MEDDDFEVKKTKTKNKLEDILKTKKETFEKQNQDNKLDNEKKIDIKKEQELLRKSIVKKVVHLDTDKIKNKLSNIINNYLEKHKINKYEKIPDFVDDKQDDSLLIKNCDITDKNTEALPLIIISENFYEKILDFIDNYSKYDNYNKILTLKKKLLIPKNKINNYNIFHTEKSNDEYNSFIAETISSTKINIYNEKEIKDIKNKIIITSKEFKDDFSVAIEKWIATVYNIISDYIIFKLKENPLYYICDKCKMPILYKENNIENNNMNMNININNNECKNIINENKEVILDKEKIIKKRNEKKKEKEKLFMDKIKKDENELKKYKSLFNIANNIISLIDFQDNNYNGNNSNSNIANPPKKSDSQGNYNNFNIVNREKNLLYYDQNKYTNYDILEREISGAFIFVSEQNLLEHVMEYLNSKSLIDKFILIVNGKNCEEIFEYLNNQHYLELFEAYCILSSNQKYESLSNKYNLVINIFKTKKEIIQFIHNYKKLEVVHSIKLINFKKYSDSYFKFHKTISSYYGNFVNTNLYSDAISYLKDYLEAPGNPENNHSDSIVDLFKIFEKGEEEKVKIIKLYTESGYHTTFNKWLYQFDSLAYEKTSYFLSGIMYSLDLFGNEQKPQENKEYILYRGISINLIDLIPYKNSEGKIISFASFTSTSVDKSVAENIFSDADSTPEYRKSMNLFSVIFYIKYNLKNNWFPNGIDVYSNNISAYAHSEKEILFQPFTFFKVVKADIDFDKYIAKIDLEIIGRKEILEEQIKDNDKMITYNIKEGIMEVVN